MKDAYEACRSYQAELGNTGHDDPFEVAPIAEHMVLAAVNELMEALDETPWKRWRKYDQDLVRSEWKQIDGDESDGRRHRYLEELIDVQHFLFNCASAAGFTAGEYESMFFHKLGINRKRLENGHNLVYGSTSKEHR